MSIDGGKDIRIKVIGFGSDAVDDAVGRIVSTAKRTGSEISGPIPLPQKSRIFTVVRSPHIDKRSREKFEIKCVKRLVIIISPSPQTMDALNNLDLPAGVDIKIL